MLYLKKLLLAPIFLSLLCATLYLIKPLLTIDLLFTLFNKTILIDLGLLTLALLGTSAIYIIFVSLAKDWKVVLPTILLAGGLPFLLFDSNIAQVLSAGIIISLFLSFSSLVARVPEYLILKTIQGPALTFAPAIFISSSIKGLMTFFILAFSIGYYALINQQIQQNGFEIPDALIEQSINFTQTAPKSEMDIPVKGVKYLAQVPNITPEQIEFLKQNKQLLEQSGIDPAVLDSINQPVKPASTSPSLRRSETTKQSLPVIDTKELTKNLLESQFNSMLKPYLSFIPIIAALIFFSELQFFATILGTILISPLLWVSYFLLKTLGYIREEKELQELKKMVV